jgi:hypothetical protein
MRKWVILFFIIKPFINLSQNEEYRGSAWSSIVVRHKFSDNYNFVFDLGYRTFDDYFKRRKQDLIRVLIERKISDKHSLGLGVAYFENISSNFSTFKKEFRPFLHYQFVNKRDKSSFSIRLRNEWRNYFEENEIVNRTRLQLSYEHKINNYFFPKVSFEQFISVQKKITNEQRFSISNAFTISEKINLNVFYILQLQSNIKFNNKVLPQNIFGLQLNINI